jgi:hypothetical protein
MAGGLKKWFMLQVWRLQQVAALLTLMLMALNLALLIWGYVKWRSPIIGNSVAGPLILLAIFFGAIWGFAVIWDLKLKMWRDQMAVLVDKNPYMKEKFSPKEIAVYGMVWLPMLDHMAKSDPSIKEHAVAMRKWLKRELKEDALTKKDIDDIFEYLGEKKMDPLGLEKQ